MYVLGQLLIYGPITGVFILMALGTYQSQKTYHKLIKRTSIGVLLFLLVFSFGGNLIEPNWSVGIIPLLIVLTHDWLDQKKRVRKIFYYTVPVSLILIFAVRTHMV
jgi:hypothetical protein